MNLFYSRIYLVSFVLFWEVEDSSNTEEFVAPCSCWPAGQFCRVDLPLPFSDHGQTGTSVWPLARTCKTGHSVWPGAARLAMVSGQADAVPGQFRKGCLASSLQLSGSDWT